MNETMQITNQQTKHFYRWYQPTLSPEHGVYIILICSFLMGAAAAQNWTGNTSLAFLGAFLGFQAEYPLSIQFKQRKTIKPRFLFWGLLYSLCALIIAMWLSLQTTTLLWVYLAVTFAFVFDFIEIFYKQRKSIINELVTFAAVCLSAPLAYLTIIDNFTPLILGLWLLNTVYFSNSIFTIKLRKPKTNSLQPAIIYNLIAIAICGGLYWFNYLGLITVLAYSLALIKLIVIIWQREWYLNVDIKYIAIIETITALIFLLIVSLSILPVHLSNI
jgi:hypothetical protein